MRMGLGYGIDTKIVRSKGSSGWSSLSDGTTSIRRYVLDCYGYTDKTLTPTGFPGIEGVDWENIDKRLIPGVWWDTITVGVDKDYATINEAIVAAYSGNRIIIDAGTYNEALDLTTKRLWLQGSGSLETKIYYTGGGGSTIPTLDIATNCKFTNIYIDRVGGSVDTPITTSNAYQQHYCTPVINVDNCNVIFENCQVGKFVVNIKNGKTPFLLQNGASVTMTGSIIESTNSNNIRQNVIVLDSSRFSFEGTKYRGGVIATSSSVVNIDVDEWWTDGDNTENSGIAAYDDSNVSITINTNQVNSVYNSNTIVSVGLRPAGRYNVYDSATLEISGNEITGSFVVFGLSCNLILKNIITTVGGFWIGTNSGDNLYHANTSVVTIDNCQVFFDVDDDSQGFHIIEDYIGCEFRLINGTVLEFSGHSGTYLTMGNPSTSNGMKLYMRNSEIRDNKNDNIPFGVNYVGCVINFREADIEDSTLTNKNSDLVSAHPLMVFGRYASMDIKIRLKNVVFNSTEVNADAMYQSGDISYTEDDYIHIDGLTYNKTGTGILFDDQHNGGDTTLTLLRSNSPLWGTPSIAPTGLTLTLISAGVKIDFVDNSGGLDFFEVWGRNDSDEAALLYTLLQGVITKNDLCNPVDMRYYKVRGKRGKEFTNFSDEVGITMLGSEIVVNGDFTVATGWTTGAGWTITGGKANFDVALGNGSVLSRAGVFTLNKKYRIKFTISDCAGDARMYMFSNETKFTPPDSFFPNSNYTWYLTCIQSSTIISHAAYNAANGGSNFSFDDHSIKEILFP